MAPWRADPITIHDTWATAAQHDPHCGEGRARSLTDWLTPADEGFHTRIKYAPPPPLPFKSTAKYSRELTLIPSNKLNQFSSGSKLRSTSAARGSYPSLVMRGLSTRRVWREALHPRPAGKEELKGKKHTHSPNPPRRVLKAAHTKGRAARRRHGGRLSACAWERPDYTEQSGGSSPGAFTQTMKEVQHLHLPGSKGRRKSNSDT